MAVRTITTRLALDGEAQFKQSMTSINGALRNLKSELALSEAQFKGQANSVEALTAKNKLLQQQIDQQKEKVRALAQAVVDASSAYGEDASITDRYRQQLNRAQIELLNMNEALEENSKYLNEAEANADKTTHSLDEFGNHVDNASNSIDTLASALQAAGVVMALKEISNALRACVDASIEFESAMASYNKVAKLSDEALAGMAEQIKELSTNIPATTTEIAQVAEAARRLGVEQESLLAFTNVMVDLGNVSDLSADQAATALARFANIVGTSADDYERLGSTIVALGNNFATSESEITEMASRLASAGKLAGLTESQIMGLAAAMSSVGIQAEAGGTAMTQTLTALEKAVTSGGEKLEKFSAIAGMSASQFAQAWERDPIVAIQAFVSGLGALDEQGESATQVLEELGLSGIRQSNMLKSLALASDTLNDTLATASQAWAENTELAATAAERYSTTEAKLKMAENAANNLKIAIGDALTPALGAAATAGTQAFSWIAEVVEKYPAFVAGVTAMIGVVGLLKVGVAGYTVAAKLGIVASRELTGAMNLIPGVAVATVITGVVVALGTFIANANEAKTATDALSDSLKATKEALEESTAGAEESGERLRNMSDAIFQLANSAELTGIQYQALQDMIQQLNESVPGLNLAYDEQTGKLNMTADAVRSLIAAEEGRMVTQEAAKAYNDLLTQQMEIAQQLKDAEVEQEKARAAITAAMQQEAETGEVIIGLKGELEQAERKATQAVEEAQEQYDALQEALEELEEEYGDLSNSTGTASNALSGTSDAAADVQEQLETLTASAEDLEKVSKELSGAQDTLSKALKEQHESGSLSLDTTLKLIEAGYEAALVINQETGAVTLNQAQYVALATAKINDQIASLETQKQSIQNKARLEAEAQAAQHAGSAYWEMAVSKAAAEKGDTAAIDAQIAAMNRLKNSLSSYTYTATTSAKKTSSASKQAKTQAEQDLETYKGLRAELDHQKKLSLIEEKNYYERLTQYRDQYLTDDSNVSEYRKVTEEIYKAPLEMFKSAKAELDSLKNLDLIDEENYYRKLAQYRDQYLTDTGNIDEYRKVTESIYKYDVALAEKEIDLWEDQSEKLLDELEERTKAVNSEMERMEKNLSGYGDLFSMEKINGTDRERMNLESLQKQIDAIDSYEKALRGLRERDISGSLMDEILGMDVDSATQYANKLLAMSEDQWEQYNELWEEKQLRAAEVAEQFYKDQLDSLETEYTEKLGDALDSMFDVSFESGVDTIQGLMDGMDSMEGPLFNRANEIADSLNSIIRSALTVPSNAELASIVSPSRIAERNDGVTAQDLNNAGAGIVNGLSTVMGSTAGNTSSEEAGVYLDSQKVGRIILPGIRIAAQETPEVKDDT